MKYVLDGFIIGLGKLLPGVSGAVLAIRLNIYEKLMDSISHFFKNIKENICFLSLIGIGAVIAVIIGSQALLYLLDKYYLIIISAFAILIATGIPSLYKDANNKIITVIAFILAMALVFLPKIDSASITTSSYLFMGMIEAFASIIPGISGTAIYVSLGMYDDVLALFSDPFSFEFGLFVIGMGICAIVMVKLISHLFKKFRGETNSAILGFLIASILLMLIKK